MMQRGKFPSRGSCQKISSYQRMAMMAPIDLGPPGSKPLERTELGTETEAEKHLKKLLDKQLETKITMKEQFKQHRQFTHSSTYTPLTELLVGTHTLEQFQKTEKAEEKHEELQRSGLTEEEIYIYLLCTNEMKKEQQHFPVDPNILKEKIKTIENKLKIHQEGLCQPQTFSDAKKLSRHEMDIEKTLYAGCNSKNQLSSLVTDTKSLSETGQPSDPFEHVKRLSEQLMEKVRKKRKRVKGKNDTGCNSTLKLRIFNKATDNVGSEFSDVKPISYDPNIHHVIVPLEESEVNEKRLTIKEIQQLPRFENYNPGVPSKILYLKNLHPKVKTEELIALFGIFESANVEPIHYRLLSGRMKGQAFVTFSDISVAEKAMKSVNGYKLRDQPIIIQYGKKS